MHLEENKATREGLRVRTTAPCMARRRCWLAVLACCNRMLPRRGFGLGACSRRVVGNVCTDRFFRFAQSCEETGWCERDARDAKRGPASPRQKTTVGSCASRFSIQLAYYPWHQVSCSDARAPCGYVLRRARPFANSAKVSPFRDITHKRRRIEPRSSRTTWSAYVVAAGSHGRPSWIFTDSRR